MARLLAQLARGMIFAHRNFNELQRKLSRRYERRRPSTMCWALLLIVISSYQCHPLSKKFQVHEKRKKYICNSLLKRDKIWTMKIEDFDDEN
jgi:predicted protein tyrosine phosphatase